MSGVQYMVIGGVLLSLSIAGTILINWILERKKKQIREQTYQIYE